MSDNATDIAVVGFAHAPHVPETFGTTNGVEMLVPCFRQLYDTLGIGVADIDFWCSGSSDYLAGRAFSFISAIDSIGAVPPINESHVEMDAAWALYEAWVKLRSGQAKTALVYGFGKASAGTLRQVLTLQTDPYLVAPLWPDALSLAGLQARAGLDAGRWSEREMAAVSAADDAEIDKRLAAPYVADPLRAHDIAPITDGAAAIVLAAGDRARELCERPAWLTGIAHRIDTPMLGARDLTVSSSTTAAARAVTGGDTGGFDVAELHAQYSHEQLILKQAIGLGDGTRVNPSGGPLAGNPMFAAGLERIGFAATEIMTGTAGRALAHASSGPALQHNLVATLEAR
ncbi:thiolase domain-containing protein [Nocardia terpenica]|uniref:thiolase domain-containing protein n=1 Tax=Nocardia terpenica TaxID=455432 RepID=UPI0018953B01|nr:thiolase domain-containing protein [Nocardia terpenica]MBF6062345.1 thiolase domain-containing protein [Nocardia terpenica]MBF6104433.1 thiolase domain-containing protein [Nocardia terpenica]MBF6109711.1 thiolase domain-containing protein [Nocardia terpenica]MBF6120017.1 thiolase domain-containing protein [Nocardia terpenica]MBF6152428.1 thiolase domain-containing protein [Nocardia terpenica]